MIDIWLFSILIGFVALAGALVVYLVAVLIMNARTRREPGPTTERVPAQGGL